MSDSFQSSTLLFYFDLFNTIIWIPCVLMYTLLFLTIFYVYQDNLRRPSHLSFRQDYVGYLFLTSIWTFGDIYGKSGHLSFDDNLFKQQMAEPALKFFLLCDIDVYYDNYDELEQDKRRYQTMYTNIRFHYRPGFRTVPEIEITNTQSSSDQNTNTELVSYQGFKRTVFLVKNIDEIDRKYICSSSKLILREPYELTCGHRLYQSYINLRNNTIHCLICSKISIQNQILLDKDFQTELEDQSITCALCDWTGRLKTYQKHFDQTHSDQFISCSVCSKQIDRRQTHQHYLNKTHQELVLNILLHLQNQREKSLFSQLSKTISLQDNDEIILHNSLQQITHEYRSLTQDMLSLKMCNEENNYSLARMTYIQDVLREDIDFIKERLEGEQMTSFDGTLLWRISNIQQKLDDAKFERRRSIYSPQFYSSTFGYKMCARLFFDGINNTRRDYLAIYFLLMRGDYDALLEWPFCFKISFSLLDQSTPNDKHNHLSKCFWPDRQSICFQRPRVEMNECYGIDNFVSLDQFHQNRYVQNDTIFIRIEVDFLNQTPALLSDSGAMLIDEGRHTDTNDDELLRKFLFLMERSNATQ